MIYYEKSSYLFRLFFADFLVQTVKLKPIIKAQIPEKLVTSGIMM